MPGTLTKINGVQVFEDDVPIGAAFTRPDPPTRKPKPPPKPEVRQATGTIGLDLPGGGRQCRDVMHGDLVAIPVQKFRVDIYAAQSSSGWWKVLGWGLVAAAVAVAVVATAGVALGVAAAAAATASGVAFAGTAFVTAGVGLGAGAAGMYAAGAILATGGVAILKGEVSKDIVSG